MVIVETSVFTRQVLDLLSDEEYRKLQIELANYPDAGAVIKGSGGLRKMRWKAKGRGKRGGVRVIYHWQRLPINCSCSSCTQRARSMTSLITSLKFLGKLLKRNIDEKGII